MPETVPRPAPIAEVSVNEHAVRGRFYIWAAAFVILLSTAGFLPSFVDRSRRVAEPTWLVTVHGTLAGAWLLLFLAQASLVAGRWTTLHRRLGIVGPFIAIAMIATGSLTVIDMAKRGHDLSGDIARMAVPPGSPAGGREELVAAMFPPLLAFANFGILTGLGLWFRHRPAAHKRLMLLALGPLLVTPLIHLGGHLIGRWPALYAPLNLAIPIVANTLLFAGAVHDKRARGRIHPICLWVPILLIVETFGMIVLVMPTPGWRRLAMWLVS